MEPQYLRAYRADDGASDSGPIRFVASTEGVARDGMVIEASAWDLTNYKRNPVVLWSHDYWGERPPIGRAKVQVEGRKLMADVTFDAEDEFAASIERKVRAGFLNAASVGWNTLDMSMPVGPDRPPRVAKADLLDISVVPIPSDPKALKERQARALADLGATLAKLTEPDDDPEPDALPEELEWAGTALLMARLYLDPGEDSERTRRQRHERLSRRYRRLGKEAPEYLSRADLAPLSETALLGLFFADEPALLPGLGATVAGALSPKDRGDVGEALRLLTAVLARGETPGPDPDHDDISPEAVAAIRARLGAA